MSEPKNSAATSIGLLPAILAALVCAGGIAVVQPGLAHNVHKLQQRDDVFLLPPPNQLRVMSLGYRAAATDIVWAKLVLEFGLHHQEKRPFPDITRYVDGILALEPDFPTIYDFVDTMVVYPPPPGGTEQDARIARAYLQRGTVERPYDYNVWLHYGQFIAFVAPSFLKDKAEIERWRVDGANAIARAVELGADGQRSLSAAAVLNKAGERKATIDHVQRLYAVTDDPELRQQYLLRLRSLQADAVAEQSVTLVERELQSHYRFLSRGTGLLIGPRRPPATCAGPGNYEKRGCPPDWQRAVDDAK